MITEVLPDTHRRLWVTVGERTLYVEIKPLQGPDSLIPLRLEPVFKRVQVTEDGLALRWPGGFRLSQAQLTARRPPRWLTHLGVTAPQDRFRPLLPLLRHATPGVALRTELTPFHVVRMFSLREGELGTILRAYPVPEPVMLHRLHDLGLFFHYHLYPELPVALLRRPWAYAAHRCPREQHLHTLLSCLTWGRLDLIEDPLWALARAEIAEWA